MVVKEYTMPTKYCTKCGNKHDFSFETPSYCESCGNPFGQIVAKQEVTKAPTLTESARRLVEEDDTPLPAIDKLSVTIETFTSPRVTIESVQAGATSENNLNEKRPRGNKFKYQDFEPELRQHFAHDRANSKEEVSPG